MHENRLNTGFLLALLLVFSQAMVLNSSAQAQLDEERPPGSYDEDGDIDEGPSEPEVEEPAQPPRILASLGGGSSLRIVQDLDYQQRRVAPGFIDASGAFVFGGAGIFRHGVSLTISLAVSGDGGLAEGFDPGSQFALTPAYLAYLRLSEDWDVFGHIGPSFAYTTNASTAGGTTATSVGLEVGVGGAFMVLAGLGIYAEGTHAIYLGSADTIHPILSVEAGLMIDYEVLP